MSRPNVICSIIPGDLVISTSEEGPKEATAPLTCEFNQEAIVAGERGARMRTKMISSARFSLVVFMAFWMSVPWMSVLFFSDNMLVSIAGLAIFALSSWALVASERKAGAIPPKIGRRAGGGFWETQRLRRQETSQEMRSFSLAGYRDRCNRASAPRWLDAVFLALLLVSLVGAVLTYQGV